MQPAEEPDDFLPSPGAHHSFLPQAGGQALRKGRRQAQGQVGLGAGSTQGGWCPRLQPRPWPDCLGPRVCQPALSPRQGGDPGAFKEGTAARPGSSLVPPLPRGPSARLSNACSAAALCWRCPASSRSGPSSVLQMEAAILLPLVLGLLLLPLLAVLLMALCVRCRELPGEWELVG